MFAPMTLLLILMSVMDIRHVTVLMLGAGVLVFVRMCSFLFAVGMELVVTMQMFMHNWHMNVKMSVFFVCQ
jgi:hypothetical protein